MGKKIFPAITTGFILFIFSYLLFVPLSFLPAYNELKLPVAALLVLFLMWQYPLKFTVWDIWPGLFVLLLIISIVDISHLAWSWQPLFTWVLVFFLAIAGRPFFSRYEHAMSFLFQGVFWVTVLYLLFRMIQYNEELKIRMMMLIWPWDIFGKNINFAPLVPLLLLPSVVLRNYNSWWGWPLRLAAISGVIYLILYFDTTICWVILILYFVVGGAMLLRNKYRFTYWAGILMGVLCLYWWGAEAIGEFILKELEKSETSRLPFDKLAFALFQEHPVNGTGVGSWFFTAGKFVGGVEENKYLLKPTELLLSFKAYYAYNHNYFTRLLAEAGLLSLLVWVGIPIVLFVDLYMEKRENRIDNLRYYLMLLGFYISCLTMRQSVSDYIDLSEVHLIGFLGYGMYTRKARLGKIALPKYIGIGLALLLVTWFSYNFLTNHYSLKAIAAAKKGRFQDAIDYLEPYYHPQLKTSIKDVEPMARHLARWYNEVGESEKAKYWYEEAMKCAPFDPSLRFEYNNFQEIPEILRNSGY